MKWGPGVVTLVVTMATGLLSSCVVPRDPPSSSPSMTTTTSPATSDVPSSPAPSDTPSPTTVSPSPTEIPPLEPKDYGNFPPTYLDELKDLTGNQYPKELMTYKLSRFSEGAQDTAADYTSESYATLNTVLYLFNRENYARSTERWENGQYVGRAVCGNPMKYPDQIVCVMAAKFGTLEVRTASEQITLADVGAFTEALYDSL